MEVNKNFLEEDNVDSNFENVLMSVNLNYYLLVTIVFPKHVSNSISIVSIVSNSIPNR